jgi:hypothetical protein
MRNAADESRSKSPKRERSITCRWTSSASKARRCSACSASSSPGVAGGEGGEGERRSDGLGVSRPGPRGRRRKWKSSLDEEDAPASSWAAARRERQEGEGEEMDGSAPATRSRSVGTSGEPGPQRSRSETGHSRAHACPRATPRQRGGGELGASRSEGSRGGTTRRSSHPALRSGGEAGVKKASGKDRASARPAICSVSRRRPGQCAATRYPCKSTGTERHAGSRSPGGPRRR